MSDSAIGPAPCFAASGRGGKDRRRSAAGHPGGGRSLAFGRRAQGGDGARRAVPGGERRGSLVRGGVAGGEGARGELGRSGGRGVRPGGSPEGRDLGGVRGGGPESAGRRARRR